MRQRGGRRAGAPRPAAAPVADRQSGSPLLLLLTSLFFVALFAFLAYQSAERQVDQDEFEHLNAAHFIKQGETIYGTFFENHPPLTALLLQPIVRSAEDPEAMIDRARALMLGLSGAILFAVGILAKPLSGWFASLLAAVFLLAQTFFFQKTLEVRPDVPALLLLVLGLLLLTRSAARRAYGWPIAAGAVLATAVLFTPKVIYVAAAASLAACFAAAQGAGSLRARTAIRTLALITAGVAVVAGIAAAELARRGLLDAFFSDVVLTSLRLRIDDPEWFRWHYVRTTLVTNTACWALAGFGIAVLLRRRRELPAGYAAVLCASLAGGLVGLLLIKAPMRQYFLTFLPPVAIAGAAGLESILRWVKLRWGAVATTALLVAILLAATVPPALAMRPVPPMTGQLDVLRKVRELTNRDERVLDCWTGLYLTRLPAYRYFFLNSDIQRLIPRETLEQDLLRMLDNPRVTLMIVDDDCRRLPDAALRRVQQLFNPVPGFPFLWRRR
jgi:4-amino-4-deoxy-L-arabinose transferase-like glycosyltransferase